MSGRWIQKTENLQCWVQIPFQQYASPLLALWSKLADMNLRDLGNYVVCVSLKKVYGA